MITYSSQIHLQHLPRIKNVSALTNVLVMKGVVVKLTLSQTLASEKKKMFELFLSTLKFGQQI